MPFIKKTCTEQEGKDILLRNDDLKKAYKDCGRGNIIGANISLTTWFFNEEENAAFCRLELGSNPHSPDGRTIFMLRVKNHHVVFQLKSYNTVVFLHNSPLCINNIYQVKYLITSAFSVVGRWGDGRIEGLDEVPDPFFKFSLATGG
ncbi:hypothetical protein V2E67_002797 [Citrobacter freundii]|nr:hypothetical protein [Citrobacter freundii]